MTTGAGGRLDDAGPRDERGRTALDRAAIARDRDLAHELLLVDPAHPRVLELAQSVLARAPELTGMVVVSALHHAARRDDDRVRSLLHELIARQDEQLVLALQVLRDVEYRARNYPESRRLAELVLRAEPDAGWADRMALGAVQVFTGDREAGWRLVDEAVEQCARTEPDEYPEALAERAGRFLATGAPPDRFRRAAEQAVAAEPGLHRLATMLAFALVYDYRVLEAETLLRSSLSVDPTDSLAQSGLMLVRAFLTPVENGEATLDDLRRAGLGERAWRIMRDQVFGIGVDQALAALDQVLPAALARVLREPYQDRPEHETQGESMLLGWHDGQAPGTGALWGCDGPVRLMSEQEIDAAEQRFAQDPAVWPEWVAADGICTLLATDEVGGHLYQGVAGRLFQHRPGEPDREVAPSLADWCWDRVVGFGGDDRRLGLEWTI